MRARVLFWAINLNANNAGVAASSVAVYLATPHSEDQQAHTRPDDYVFCTEDRQISRTLYYSLVERLLLESGLQRSSSGARRSTYCFRHTYAAFRLTEGVDVYFLAKQMGTSVKMIEDHYGHITPVKNADLILQGLSGWEPMAALPQLTETDRVNADTKERKPSKRKSDRPAAHH